MNGNKYLLDTNIILYILSGDQTIAKYLHQKFLYASVISEIELFSFRDLTIAQEKQIKNFLSAFRIISIDEAIKNEAISLRKKYALSR